MTKSLITISVIFIYLAARPQAKSESPLFDMQEIKQEEL